MSGREILWALILTVGVANAAQYDHSYSGFWEGKDSAGNTIQNFDMLISLQRKAPISTLEQGYYDSIITYWADAIYEMSNGGNRLANVHIVTDGNLMGVADVKWGRCGSNADAEAWSSGLGDFVGGGSIYEFDYKPCANTGENSLKDTSGYPDTTNINGYKLKPSNHISIAGILAHESMHFIYGLADEYGNGDLGLGIYMGIGITEAVDSNRIIFKVRDVDPTPQPENWKKLKIYASAYSKGVPFVFYGNPPSPAVVPNECSATDIYVRPMLCDSSHYYAGEVVYNDAEMSVTIPVYDSQGKPVVFTDQGSGDWFISWGDGAWFSPFSIAADAGDVGIAGTARYHHWNLGSLNNGNPHNYQGRFFRRADGSYCTQWDVVSGKCANNPSTMMAVPKPLYSLSLLGREPVDSDSYSATDNRCSNYLNYLAFDESKLFGDGINKPDYDYIHQWKLCRQIGQLKSFTVPRMRVELDKAGARQHARENLNIQWMDGVQTEMQVVLDYSWSMAHSNKIQDAIAATKLIAWSKTMSESSGDLSGFGFTYFNDSVHTVASIDKASLFDLLNSLNSPLNNTALYDALYQAISNFSKSRSTEKVLYLMSDGLNNRGSKTMDTIIQLCKGKGIKIHTFSYGSNAAFDTLASLSKATGGDYRRDVIAVGTSASSASGVVFNYATFNYGYSATPTLSLAMGDVKSVNTSADDRRVTFTAFGIGLATNSLLIKDPNGNVVTPLVEALDSAKWTIVRYQLDSTQLHGKMGDWTVQSNSTTPMTVQVLRWNAGYATEQMTLQVQPGLRVAYPAPIFITTRLMGIAPLTGMRVQGYLLTPALDTVNIYMNDQGVDGDAVANDGLFTYRFTNYADSGHYSVTVNIDNPEGLAKPSYIGSSRTDGATFGDTISRFFEYSMSRGFDVIGLTDDDHPAPPNPIDSLIVNGQAIVGRIDNAIDEDWFLLKGLDLYSTLYLSVETSDTSSWLRVTGATASNVLDSFKLTKGLNEIEIPAWKLQIGMMIAMRGQANSNYGISASLKNSGNIDVGEFELANDWSVLSGGAIIDTTNPYLGKASLHGTQWGYREIRSRAVQTTEFTRVSNVLSIKVLVPRSPVNPYWIGTVGLRIEFPSSNLSFDLGTKNLEGLSGGLYNTLYYDVSNALLTKFAGPYGGVRFVVVMNGEPGVYVDQLEFAGKTIPNVVAPSSVICPDPGCSENSAIDLTDPSGTRRVVAIGNLWMKLLAHPLDWTPTNAYFGIGSEDGLPLTGEIMIDGVTTVLTGYYQKIPVAYGSIHTIPIRLTNYTGRPYRLSWWFE